jgi:hypothetical protein
VSLHCDVEVKLLRKSRSSKMSCEIKLEAARSRRKEVGCAMVVLMGKERQPTRSGKFGVSTHSAGPPPLGIHFVCMEHPAQGLIRFKHVR